MTTVHLSRRLVLLGLATGSVLSACVVVPAGRPYGGHGAPEPYGADEGSVVLVAPPPLRVEAVGPAPGPGYIWIAGYWTWQLGRHVWIGGRWAPARPGHGWVPHRWVPRGRGWREAPGRWQRR